MDTRSKILTSRGPWPNFVRPLAVATGAFDVLVAEHVRELSRARQGASALLAIVLPEAKLLTIGARAELVAALRAVDYVIAADGSDVDGLIASLQPAHVVRLEESDGRRFQELRERVLSAR